MTEKSACLPRNRTGDSVGTLPFGDTCHKAIHMHVDMYVHVSVSVYAYMCVCRCKHLPIKWTDEYTWYIWDKAMHFLLQISPLLSFSSALRWFVQHIIKTDSFGFNFITWINNDHNKLKVTFNILSPNKAFLWRYCLKTKGTEMSIIWLLNGYTRMTPGVTALSFSSNLSTTEKINRGLNSFHRDIISLNSWTELRSLSLS